MLTRLQPADRTRKLLEYKVCHVWYMSLRCLLTNNFNCGRYYGVVSRDVVRRGEYFVGRSNRAVKWASSEANEGSSMGHHGGLLCLEQSNSFYKYSTKGYHSRTVCISEQVDHKSQATESGPVRTKTPLGPSRVLKSFVCRPLSKLDFERVSGAQ